MINLIVRFVIFVALYAAIVFGWAVLARSHAGMGIFGMGIIFSGGAVAAWLVALLLRRCAAEPFVRLPLHVSSTVILFAIFAVFTLVVIYRIGRSIEFDDVAPFAGIVAIAALADAAVGFWQDRRRAAQGGARFSTALMQRRFFRFLARFFVFGAAYVMAVVMLLVMQAHRDDAFAIFLGGYLLAGAAAAAWVVAVVSGRLVPDQLMRFVLQVAATTAIFAALGYGMVVTVLKSITYGQTGPLFSISAAVAIAAVVDGAFGVWLDRAPAAPRENK